MKYFSSNLFVLLYCGLLLKILPVGTLILLIVSLVLSVMAVSNILKYINASLSICVYNFFVTLVLFACALSTLARIVVVQTALNVSDLQGS